MNGGTDTLAPRLGRPPQAPAHATAPRIVPVAPRRVDRADSEVVRSCKRPVSSTYERPDAVSQINTGEPAEPDPQLHL